MMPGWSKSNEAFILALFFKSDKFIQRLVGRNLYLKSFLTMSLRAGIVITLLLALTTVFGNLGQSGHDWLVLCDVSDSVALIHQKRQRSLLAFYQREVTKIARQLTADDRLSVLFFGQESEIALPFATSNDQLRLTPPTVGGSESRLDKAIALALNLPCRNRVRWVIYSDGNIRSVYLAKSRALLRQRGGEVAFASALPSGQAIADVSLTNIALPTEVALNSSIAGVIVGQSNRPGQVRVSIYAQDRLWQEEQISLTKADSFRIFFTIPALQTPWQRVTASAVSLDCDDEFGDNNRVTGKVHIRDKPRVIWVGDTAYPNILERDFRLVAIGTRAVSELTPAALQNVQAVVIAAGSAEELTSAMPGLKNYVFVGGGLLVLGHATTLGPGRYAQTPLEEALPVWCATPQENSRAILIILDVSGSMGERHGVDSKLAQAKSGIVQACATLADDDRLSLVLFREGSHIALPFDRWSELKTKLWNVFQSVEAHGGTNLSESLALGLKTFKTITAGRKQLLIVSDGVIAETSATIDNLVANLRQLDVTLSVIATGADPHGILKNIAQQGQGRFYDSGSQAIAACLTEEIQKAAAAKIREGDFPLRVEATNQWQMRVPFVGKQIHRFISVTPKNWGNRLIATTRGDPILVAGYYGSGRSAVLTTSLADSWRGDVTNEELANLMSDMIAWLVQPDTSEWEIKSQLQAEAIIISLHLPQEENLHNRNFRIVFPQEEITGLQEVGIGCYETKLDFPPAGEYRLLLQEFETEWLTKKVFDLVMPYPHEYQKIGLSPLHFPAHKITSEAQESLPIVPFWLIGTACLFLIERAVSFFCFRRTLNGNYP